MSDLNPEISYHQGARGAYPLLSEMWVEQGNLEDWKLLQALHYKAHTMPVGAAYYRLGFRGETIGVSIIGMSRPLLKERHALFPNITPGHDTQISNIHRYAYINDNFRVVGRFVVDTMFRSGGAAYRFLNLSSRMHGFTYMEIQSSMAAYNPFANKAGFQMVRPMRSPMYAKGLAFMRTLFEAHPADAEAVIEELEAMPAKMQARMIERLKTFYYDNSPLEKTGSRRHYSGDVVDAWDARRTVGKIQGLCFSCPIYGIYENPDHGRELPKRLPLLAFDLQKPTEALDLDGVARLEAA